MHFEMLQLDTMQAAKELPEVGLDPYYFILHVSIDNSHSGHAAMSLECVVEYIPKITEIEGKEATHTAWRRIQAGYVFSEWLGSEEFVCTGDPTFGPIPITDTADTGEANSITENANSMPCSCGCQGAKLV
ncbi:hypothetical protein ACN38_g12224 [Penicillium nordicum]|uniref:Uncharacterized protein n=1 Tax=Penicillium nordicum TaxID=229535 RepID=A0A0M8NXI5_9EURO|nr:hypothetical protein ACN38_g12224 [Penicillium nordicum]